MASRLIRVRIQLCDGEYVVGSTAKSARTKHPLGVNIHLGGPLYAFKSQITMETRRDMLYFDQLLPIQAVAYGMMQSVSSHAPSSLASVAIKVECFRRCIQLIRPLWLSVDNNDLTHIILVCPSQDDSGAAVTGEPDHWGFQQVPEPIIRDRMAKTHALALRVLKEFSADFMYNLTYTFVVE